MQRIGGVATMSVIRPDANRHSTPVARRQCPGERLDLEIEQN